MVKQSVTRCAGSDRTQDAANEAFVLMVIPQHDQSAPIYTLHHPWAVTVPSHACPLQAIQLARQ